MQKAIAVFVASLFCVPAGSLAQDSKVSDGSKSVGAVIASTGPLRESAIRQARLAVAAEALVQAPKSPSFPRRHPAVFGSLLGASIGAALNAAMFGLPYDTCIVDSEVSGCFVENLPITAGIGAAVGALIGHMIAGGPDQPFDPTAPRK